MHAAKVVLLLLITLGVMRGASWSLGWVLRRVTRLERPWIALTSNTGALLCFAGFLVAQSIPGEILDWSALIFGAVVFTTCALIDARWTRWGRLQGKR